MNIQTRLEGERGCGYRKPGGKYLMGGGVGFPCGMLPVKLENCPCCGNGIKFSRGFQWMGPELLMHLECGKGCPSSGSCQPFRGCQNGTIKKLGLLWIGEKFYPTPQDFVDEANALGISKRISAIPKNLKLGETWVMLAHKKVNFEGSTGPGIFRMFIPTHLEYVVREKNGKVIDGQKKLKKLERQGFQLVRVIKDEK